MIFVMNNKRKVPDWPGNLPEYSWCIVKYSFPVYVCFFFKKKTACKCCDHNLSFTYSVMLNLVVL